MEDKKLDINSIIGFVLIFGILVFMFYQNQPTPEELEAQKAERAKVEAMAKEAAEAPAPLGRTPLKQENPIDLKDSTSVAQYKNAVGAFGYTRAVDGTTVLENDLLYLVVANKGGQVVEARLKHFVTHDSVPVHLVKDGNANFALTFSTSDNRVLNTTDLYFEPSPSKNGENQVLSMKAKVGEDRFLEYHWHSSSCSSCWGRVATPEGPCPANGK